VTPNAGGEDLIDEGVTGFLVPIRSPEVIADRLAWLADHRGDLPAMRAAARRKAGACTWEQYEEKVLRGVDCTLSARGPSSEFMDHPAVTASQTADNPRALRELSLSR
jgi:hypothetical protein